MFHYIYLAVRQVILYSIILITRNFYILKFSIRYVAYNMITIEIKHSSIGELKAYFMSL